MEKREVTLPVLALIVGTRAMLGAGAALLLADTLNKDQRKAVGWTLVFVGAITTIPLAIGLFGKNKQLHAGKHRALSGNSIDIPHPNLYP